MKLNPIAILTCYGGIIASYFIVFMESSDLMQLLREDGPVENLTALAFLLAFGLFTATYSFTGSPADQSRPEKLRRLSYLLLGILMLICAGEEISWGQRIFDWKTPELFGRLNAQDETNLHNLQFLHVLNADGTHRSLLRSLLNPNRLFSIFWLVCFVCVPVMARVSARAASFLRRVGCPILPLWIGGLFLLNYTVFYVALGYLKSTGSGLGSMLDELKECNYALVYVLASLGWLTMDWKTFLTSAAECLPLERLAMPLGARPCNEDGKLSL